MENNGDKKALNEGYQPQVSKVRHNGYQPQYEIGGYQPGRDTYGYQPTSDNVNTKPLTTPPTGRIPIQKPVQVKDTEE